MLRYWGLAALAAGTIMAGGLALAHQDDGDQTAADAVASAMLDCEQLPVKAMSSVPQPVAAWTRVACRYSGQVLVESPEWQWRYPASYTTPVIVSAGMASPHTAGARYFTGATVSVRDAAATARLHEELSREVLVYAENAGASAPSAAYTLVASNDLGDQLQVHFLQRGSGDFVGVVCAPKCIPESTFIVQKRGG
jgi:hypothetical protein